MYSAKLYRTDTGYLVLTDSTSDYLVTDITGLGPSSAHINSTNYARIDGAILNSRKLNSREIVITVVLEGNIEEARQRIYNYFRTKEAARFYFANGSRDAYIDGWVQSVEVDLFSMREQMVLTLYCPDPYFQADEEISKSLTFNPARFYFPFAIKLGNPVAFSIIDPDKAVMIPNDSDTPAEVRIEAAFSGSVSDLVIRNLTTGEWLGVSYGFHDGDVLTIVTGRKRKSVKLTRGSAVTSLMGSLTAGSSFLELAPGENYLNYSAGNGDDDGNVEITVTYNRRYRGL